MNALVGFVLAAIGLCAYRGYKRGMFGIMYGAVTWVAILALMWFTVPVVHGFLMKTPAFHDVAYKAIYSTMEKFAPTLSKELVAGDKGVLENYIRNFVGSDEQLVEYEKKVLGEKTDNKKKSGSIGSIELSRLAEAATDKFLLVMACIVVYVIGKCIMLFVKMIIYEYAEKYDDPKWNAIGLLCGTGEGFMYSWAAMFAATNAAFTSVGARISLWIAESPILTQLNDVNFISDLLK